MELEDIIAKRIAKAVSLSEAGDVLSHLLSGGFTVWSDGTLLSTRQQVDRIKGISIQVFAREHPPPHFHVTRGDLDATFSILDCAHLHGKVTPRDAAIVRWWYERSRPLLINTWNATRPEGCPVGPIEDDTNTPGISDPKMSEGLL